MKKRCVWFTLYTIKAYFIIQTLPVHCNIDIGNWAQNKRLRQSSLHHSQHVIFLQKIKMWMHFMNQSTWDCIEVHLYPLYFTFCEAGTEKIKIIICERERKKSSWNRCHCDWLFTRLIAHGWRAQNVCYGGLQHEYENCNLRVTVNKSSA